LLQLSPSPQINVCIEREIWIDEAQSYQTSLFCNDFNQILDEEAWKLYFITKLLKKPNCRSMI